MKKKRCRTEEPQNRKYRGKQSFIFLLFAAAFMAAGLFAVKTSARLSGNRDAEWNPQEKTFQEQAAQEETSQQATAQEKTSQQATAQEETSRERNSREQDSSVPQDPGEQQFIVYFIDVGQGDASLIVCDGHSMLIDGGRSRQSDRIYSFLKNKGVTHLDYIVATHLDDDHIGGLAGALNFATTDTAFSPVSEGDSEAFRNFKKYLDRQEVEVTIPKVGEQYPLGSATITVLGPTEIVDSDNNSSIVLKVDHGENCFLFTGDAEKKEEADILGTGLDLKSTVLKIGHHGSASSTGDDFLSAVNPLAAVISCGADNEYGHPTEEVLEKLRNNGALVFRTDLQGDITFFEQNGDLYYEVEKNPDADVFMPGTAVAEDSQQPPLQQLNPAEETDTSDDSAVTRGNPSDSTPEKNEMDYIINVKTGKFHYPDCRGVKQMNEKNKRNVTCDRQELLDQGYESCGICHP